MVKNKLTREDMTRELQPGLDALWKWCYWDGMSLEEAKQALKASLDDGLRCPCCDKYARRYRRAFNSTMARSLCWLSHASGLVADGWVHVPSTAPRWLIRSNQLATVRWWGLVERSEEEPEPRLKHHGMWRPTPKGIEFAWGRTTIPRRAVTYDGKVIGHEGDEIYVGELAGKNFDYEEMMRWRSDEV
jgi:hypothetical protein